MASVLIVGPDAALLEGVVQTLGGVGHQVTVARDITGALIALRGARPLVAVIDRETLLASGPLGRLTLPHGAIVAFHTDDNDDERLPFRLQRATLAQLKLPLERNRLLALIRSVELRATAAGRDETDGKTEAPARS